MDLEPRNQFVERPRGLKRHIFDMIHGIWVLVNRHFGPGSLVMA